MTNTVYSKGDWRVYKFKVNGKVRWFIGRISEGGYHWVSPTKKDAIAICDAAYNVYK